MACFPRSLNMLNPLTDTHCCRMDTAVVYPVPGLVKPSLSNV